MTDYEERIKFRRRYLLPPFFAFLTVEAVIGTLVFIGFVQISGSLCVIALQDYKILPEHLSAKYLALPSIALYAFLCFCALRLFTKDNYACSFYAFLCTMILVFYGPLAVLLAQNLVWSTSAIERNFYEYPEWLFGALKVGVSLLLLVPAGSVVLCIVLWLSDRSWARSSVGMVQSRTRNGFPSVAWSQEVGTGETVGSKFNRLLSRMMLAAVVLGGAIGFYFGGLLGAAIGAFIGAWLASLHPVDGPAPDLRLPLISGSVAPPAPRPVTDVDRRARAAPVTRIENCEVFIEELGDELFFCVSRGDRTEGPLPVVDRVSWSDAATTFDNFEEGSHRHWFRSKTSTNELPDWDVIIAQTRVPRVVKVAESVNDHAWIVELLARLQMTFAGRNRDEIVATWRQAKEDAKRGAHGYRERDPHETPQRLF